MAETKGVVSLAAVVPLVEQHVKFFPHLITNLELQTQRFDEVIVVASGLGDSSLEIVVETLRISSYSNSCQVVANPLFPSGRNRNIGARASSADLIAFLDSDDSYHPLRNEFVLDAYRRTYFDALVMRAFTSPESALFEWNSNLEVGDLVPNRLIYPQEIFDRTFSGGRARHKEMLGAPSVLSVGVSQTESGVLHHGHLVVRRDVFLSLKQHEQSFPRNEDSVFARDILWSGKNLVSLNLALSHYRLDSSANDPREGSFWNFIKALPAAYFGSPVSSKGSRPTWSLSTH
jgi:glycosyltransferase involved in cell wall biosynthesis